MLRLLVTLLIAPATLWASTVNSDGHKTFRLHDCRDSELYVVETSSRQVSKQVTCSQLVSDAAYACALESIKAIKMVDLNCLKMSEIGISCARLFWKDKKFSDMNCAAIKNRKQLECAEKAIGSSGMIDFKCLSL